MKPRPMLKRKTSSSLLSTAWSTPTYFLNSKNLALVYGEAGKINRYQAAKRRRNQGNSIKN
jgi:hypothetical protein